MKKFVIDGQTLRNHYQGNVTLGKVFTDIEAELMAENKVVCRFHVNGKSVLEMDEHAYHGLPLDFVDKLEYESETADELYEEVIEGWLLAIPELTRNIGIISGRVRRDGFLNNAVSVSQLIENCRFFIDSLVAIQQISVPLLPNMQSEFESLRQKTLTVISQSFDALERKEYVLLADLLEYDLSNLLDQWTQVLGSFGGKSRITGSNPTTQGSSDLGK